MDLTLSLNLYRKLSEIMSQLDRANVKRDTLRVSIDGIISKAQGLSIVDTGKQEMDVLVQMAQHKMSKLVETDEKIEELTPLAGLSVIATETEQWNDERTIKLGKLQSVIKAGYTTSNLGAGSAVPATGGSGWKKIWADVPKFDGTNLVKFMAFKDAFESIVKRDTRLSDIEKFMLLIEALEGEAKAMLEGLPLTSANFNHAWDLLYDRYGRNELLVSAYMKALWELPGPVHDVRSITAFYDSIQAYTRSLESLGEKEGSYGKLLVPLLIEKLPATFVIQITRDRDRSVQHWTLATLKIAISHELASLSAAGGARIEPENMSGKLSMYPPTAAFLALSNPNSTAAGGAGRKKSCVFCTGDHGPVQCQVVSDPFKRLQIAQRDRLCFNCLAPNHRSELCRNSYRCQVCKSKHHTALHRPGSSNEQPRNSTGVEHRQQTRGQTQLSMLIGQPNHQPDNMSFIQDTLPSYQDMTSYYQDNRQHVTSASASIQGQGQGPQPRPQGTISGHGQSVQPRPQEMNPTGVLMMRSGGGGEHTQEIFQRKNKME